MRCTILLLVLLVTAYAVQVRKVNVILSQTTPAGEVVYQHRPLETGSVFSIVKGGNFVDLPNPRKGLLKLKKSTKDIFAVILRVSSTRYDKIKFIPLRNGCGDEFKDDIMRELKKSFAKNDILHSSCKGRMFHRILLKGSPSSEEISGKAHKVQAALRFVIKRIKQKYEECGTKTIIHIKLKELLSSKIIDILCASECQEHPSPDRGQKDVDTFRTIDGTFNNKNKPTFGAANTGFIRFVPAQYFGPGGLSTPIGAGDLPEAPDLPNPFHVTQDFIIEQAKSQGNRDGILHTYMQWGQFLDHDMTLAPESENGDVCEDVPCNGGEEDFQDPCFPILPVKGRRCIRLIRSSPLSSCPKEPREQINVLTAFVDASMVYGSSLTVQEALRDPTNGLMKVSGPRRDLLPLDKSHLEGPFRLCQDMGGCFLAGDVRVNEQAGLASYHTLFVREHNRIAKELEKINPSWDRERIYQETRKIIGALVQKITYEDWLPIAIGKNTLSDYTGYDDSVNPGISNVFATAAFRMGHSLVRPTFDFLNSKYEHDHPPIPLIDMFFNNKLIQKEGADGFLLGLAGNVSQEMDNELARGLTRQLFERSDNIGLDLAALNVQRGRDHGLPGYGVFIKECARRFPGTRLDAIAKATTFDDLKAVIQNKKVRDSLRDLYKDDLQNADLWPAGIAETPLPGTQLGPTFTCLFRDQFERVRDGDRFFYLNENTFTTEQLNAIRKTTLSSIMCKNVNGIVSISRNAFLQEKRRPGCTEIPKLDLSAWKANQEWKRIQGNLKQIDIGIHGSTWGVNRNGEIFVQIASTWKKIGGSLEHVTTGASGVWGVNYRGEIFFRRGVTSGNVEGSSWTQISGRLKQIDSGPFGIVYGVTTNDQIYCRSGITDRSPEGTGWVRVQGGLKYVSCGKCGCWGVSRDERIWFRNGITPHACAGKSWTNIPGSLKQLEVNSLGHTTGVYKGGTLWTRLGITVLKPSGTGWRKVTDERFTFVATGKSKLMALKADGSIFEYSY